MDKLFAKRMDELVPSGIRKVNEKALAMERAGETVIHFELGRPDFDTPEYIKNACIEDIKQGDVFYTSNFGTMELREAIAWKLKTQNNVEYKPTEIIVSVGLSEAVFDVMAAILDEGDEVLVPNPGWLNYLNVPKLLGAVPITYTLKEENDYQIDLDEIRAKVTPRTKALVLITPSNPTGGVLAEDAEDLAGDIIAEVIERAASIRNDNSFYGFMWAVAKNLSSKYLRNKSKSHYHMLDDRIIPVIENNPEHEIIANEELMLLRRELSLLAKRHRTVTVKYYIEGKSCIDIAAETGFSHSLVRNILYETRKILKEGVTMERTYGEKSYSPHEFNLLGYFAYSDYDWNKPFRERKLPGNILLSAYKQPMTISELSMELGTQPAESIGERSGKSIRHHSWKNR